MEPKNAFRLAAIFVAVDIIFTIITILTGSATPANALKSMYEVKDLVPVGFFIASLAFALIAWTMILCRKNEAKYVYIIFILSGCLPLPYMWVINGIENFSWTLKLIIGGALLYHLWVNDIEAKEKSKPPKNAFVEEARVENKMTMKKDSDSKIFSEKNRK